MYQRHHLPVGLVGVQYHLLHAGTVLLACQFFRIFRDFVVGSYLSAHIQRLCQRDGAGKHVARVGAQGVGQRTAHLVQRSGQVHTPEGLQQLHELRVLQQARVLGNHVLHPVLQGSAQVGADVGQGILLRVAQQRYFFLVTDVGARCVQLGQVVGKCRLLLVMRGIDFFLAYQQLLVVGHGQCTTTVQAQHLLRACCIGR